jgi:pantetheine-phosphate adenylyltransferase
MTKTNNHLAIYPGSFDPLTRGHEDIVHRALRFADKVIVAVAHRRTQKKTGLFDIGERVQMIRDVFKDEPRVEAAEFEGLLVNYAQKRNARIMIRGLRAVSDFEYEFQMALMNRSLWPEIETVFLAPHTNYSYLSASLVREIGSLGGDISEFVSPVVLQHLKQKFPAGK